MSRVFFFNTSDTLSLIYFALIYSSPEVSICLVVLLTNPKKTNKEVSAASTRPTGTINKKNRRKAMR